MTTDNNPNLGEYVKGIHEKWQGPGALGGEFASLPETQQVTTEDGVAVMAPLSGERAPRGSDLGDTWVGLPPRIEESGRVLGMMVGAERIGEQIDKSDQSVEVGRQQYRVSRVVVPLIEAIQTDEERVATYVALEALAAKVSTPEGLSTYKHEIAEQRLEEKRLDRK